ncbi:MAG: AAA family ATPase [Chloroflexi bacterium]|nr:MAG: AAA family ATPase [Chloroflexota bacterium]
MRTTPPPVETLQNYPVPDPALPQTDDLPALLNLLPPAIAERVRQIDRSDELLEVVMDVGRVPAARYLSGEVELAETKLTVADIQAVVAGLREFDSDNRSGIERTLHRISAIRNRQGKIIGLTCRVGRAVYGTTQIVEDLVMSGKSILLLGRPGVGKTTMLREAARVLAERRRVVVVDTSNEIGGDGDIAHPAVGRARRMQVPNPARQHEVMIEAVENHNPETIVIDEIGREQEALAARTIAERGVQLIGTAHGNTLDNLLRNPTLADLVGGVEAVTLSDEEARRRGTRKTVLERRAPPTFDVLVEIEERARLRIHVDVASAVDNALRGFASVPELRYRDTAGKLHVEPGRSAQPSTYDNNARAARLPLVVQGGQVQRAIAPAAHVPAAAAGAGQMPVTAEQNGDAPVVKVYAYGIPRTRVEQAARRLRVPLRLVDRVEDASALLTLKSYYRRRQRPISDAENLGMPVYVLRSNTALQIDGFLMEVFQVSSGLAADDPLLAEALQEAQAGVESVRLGVRHLDLYPQDARIRRHQHELVRTAQLISHSYGKEPNRRVRIFSE